MSHRPRNQGKLSTPKLSSLRSRTPYDRPSPGRNRAGISTPSAPLLGSPGNFFSKVKNLLSPAKLFGREVRHEEEAAEEEEEEEEEEADEDEDLTQDPQAYSSTSTPIFSYPSPVATSTSPNEKLQEFFKSVGNRPLTEIEMEGVLSLMKQNGVTAGGSPLGERLSSPNSSASSSTFSNLSASSCTSKTKSARPVPSKVFSTPTRSSPSGSRFSTPIKSESSEQYSPLFTQSKSRRVSMYDSPHSSNTTVHYEPVSTPYRPGNRSLLRSRQSLAESPNTENEPAVIPNTDRTSTGTSNSPLTTTAASPPKPLSQTASALLSILGDEEEKEKEKEREKPSPKPEVSIFNPYASTHKSTPRKKSTINPSTQSSPSSPSTPTRPTTTPHSTIKELELTKPNNLSHSQPKPLFPQYRPSKSSHLRESVIASPDSSPVSASGTPNRLFKFASPTTTSPTSLKTTPIQPVDPPSVFSKIENSTTQNSISPAKPLFPSVEKTTPKEPEHTIDDHISTSTDYGSYFNFIPIPASPYQLSESEIQQVEVLKRDVFKF